MPPPNPKQKIRKLGVGGGTYPQSQGCVGWSVCPPSCILLMVLLQIPCSLVVAKLMSNSCAPLPRPDSEKLKREPQSLECCRAGAYVFGLGVNEKVQNTGEHMPNFFLRCGLYCFLAFFFSNFKPPPPSPSQGLFCFSEHWADSYLHCNCCAPPPPPPTWKPYQSSKRTTHKMQNNS